MSLYLSKENGKFTETLLMEAFVKFYFRNKIENSIETFKLDFLHDEDLHNK